VDKTVLQTPCIELKSGLSPHLGEARMLWKTADKPVLLQVGEVHAWVVPLELPAGCLKTLQALLHPSERERAACFRFPHLQDAFITGRGVLRLLVGRYLDIAPHEVPIGYGPDGKPEVLGSDLQFNLAHSGGLAVYAFTLGRKVGVDLEMVKPIPDLETVSRRFFAEREVEALLALPEAERNEAFFTCWTRKEAYIKAIGKGLVQPLDRFAVTFLPGETARLSWVDGEPLAPERWQMAALPLGPKYQGALLVEGAGWELIFWRW
jgi:4'-phosphopantetheinyl transferase